MSAAAALPDPVQWTTPAGYLRRVIHSVTPFIGSSIQHPCLGKRRSAASPSRTHGVGIRGEITRTNIHRRPFRVFQSIGGLGAGIPPGRQAHTASCVLCVGCSNGKLLTTLYGYCQYWYAPFPEASSPIDPSGFTPVLAVGSGENGLIRDLAIIMAVAGVALVVFVSSVCLPCWATWPRASSSALSP